MNVDTKYKPTVSVSDIRDAGITISKARLRLLFGLRKHVTAEEAYKLPLCAHDRLRILLCCGLLSTRSIHLLMCDTFDYMAACASISGRPVAEAVVTAVLTKRQWIDGHSTAQDVKLASIRATSSLWHLLHVEPWSSAGAVAYMATQFAVQILQRCEFNFKAEAGPYHLPFLFNLVAEITDYVVRQAVNIANTQA